MVAVQAVVAAYVSSRSGKVPAADPETGGFQLAIDGRFIVEIWEIGNEAVGRIWLRELPRDGAARSQAVRTLMRQQLAELGSEQVVLSVDEETRGFYLHRRMPSAGFTERDLKDMLQSLVNAVGRYRRLSAPETASVTPMPMMMIRP